MYIVMDLGDRRGMDCGSADYIVADCDAVASYKVQAEGTSLLPMGEWRPLMERRGYPQIEGINVLDLLYEAIKGAGEAVDYVCMGTLSDLGCLILTYPDVSDYIKRVVICPGEQGRNRDYPVSEENILRDPVAAKVVMNSQIPKIVISQGTLTEQSGLLHRYLDKTGSDAMGSYVFATVNLDQGCTYGSLYIDRLNISKREPNTVLIGGDNDGKDSGNY